MACPRLGHAIACPYVQTSISTPSIFSPASARSANWRNAQSASRRVRPRATSSSVAVSTEVSEAEVSGAGLLPFLHGVFGAAGTASRAQNGAVELGQRRARRRLARQQCLGEPRLQIRLAVLRQAFEQAGLPSRVAARAVMNSRPKSRAARPGLSHSASA